MRLLRKIPALLLALTWVSCSHYYLPANRLETPEAAGVGRTARLELVGIQGGSDLQAPPLYIMPGAGSTAAPTPVLQAANANYFFGFAPAITDKIDVGVRFQPSAPLLIRGKYQLYGQPEIKADKGNLAAAIMASGGLTLGGRDASTGNSVSFTSFDIALLGGYRVWKNHLFSIGPAYALGSLSGTSPSGISANQLEVNLGYQYSNESLFLRGEIAWASGSSGQNKITGFFPGALLGFSF